MPQLTQLGFEAVRHAFNDEGHGSHILVADVLRQPARLLSVIYLRFTVLILYPKFIHFHEDRWILHFKSMPKREVCRVAIWEAPSEILQHTKRQNETKEPQLIFTEK